MSRIYVISESKDPVCLFWNKGSVGTCSILELSVSLKI